MIRTVISWNVSRCSAFLIPPTLLQVFSRSFASTSPLQSITSMEQTTSGRCTPKRVCIVGAGPSGIIAAKTLIHDTPKDTFHVTIFEALDRIGGLWPVSKDDDGPVNPEMRTNQSKHTVSFSGLAWPETTDSFPKAWQVGQYLERYVEKYPGYAIQKNTRVIQTDFAHGKWAVKTCDASKQDAVQDHVFDHLIVATGFFGKPRVPKILDGFHAPVVHSSQVRDIQDLLTVKATSSPNSGKNIVVVGGQMSGVEIAAAIALQLSSAENSPGVESISRASEYVVTHVIQKPLWIMPMFLPKDPFVDPLADEKQSNSASPFLPCDLVTYNLGWRPPGKVQNTSGHISKEAAAMTHGFLASYIGTDQTEFGPHLAMVGDVQSATPFLAVSDSYTEFVRSGKIQILQGKVEGMASTSSDTLVVNRSDESVTGKSFVVKDVAAVVLATGYDASLSLQFLATDILETLQFDPTSDAFPLALEVNSTASWKLPSLGFVGFYRSPYWGVMEMQARYLAALWTGDTTALQVLSVDTGVESILKLRNDPQRAQFPMGDYAYLMESFGEILNIKRSGDKEGERTGGVLGQRYLLPSAPDAEILEAKQSISMIASTIQSCESGKYAARAAFRAMQGDWQLQRTITSRIASYPSGILSGKAYFKPRAPTDSTANLEYLYLEEGEFKADNGINFTAKRTYVHRYTESNDTLSVWFTKTDQKTVDYFFHSLQFIPPSKVAAKKGTAPWRANSSHLCIEDLYDVEYEFYFKGAALTKWSMEYTVRGPAKDYTIRSVYTR